MNEQPPICPDFCKGIDQCPYGFLCKYQHTITNMREGMDHCRAYSMSSHCSRQDCIYNHDPLMASYYHLYHSGVTQILSRNGLEIVSNAEKYESNLPIFGRKQKMILDQSYPIFLPKPIQNVIESYLINLPVIHQGTITDNIIKLFDIKMNCGFCHMPHYSRGFMA